MKIAAFNSNTFGSKCQTKFTVNTIYKNKWWHFHMVKYDHYFSNFDAIATNKNIIFINWNQKTSVQAHYACQIKQTKKKH